MCLDTVTALIIHVCLCVCVLLDAIIRASARIWQRQQLPWLSTPTAENVTSRPWVKKTAWNDDMWCLVAMLNKYRLSNFLNDNQSSNLKIKYWCSKFFSITPKTPVHPIYCNLSNLSTKTCDSLMYCIKLELQFTHQRTGNRREHVTYSLLWPRTSRKWRNNSN